MLRLLFLLAFFLPQILFAQITYFNSASNPADNGSNDVSPLAVTPPGSMVAGDLVVIVAQIRNVTPNITISNAGGQTWTSESHWQSTTTTKHRLFWCRFDGTWDADPSVTVDGSINGLTAVMHVFRPTSGSNTWAVDNALASSTFAAPSSPFTVTRTGVTTTQANTVALAVWGSNDDNTWGSLSGSGWVVTGSAQYRNTASSDQSLTFAHKIQTSAGATGDVSKNQATLGGDAGSTAIISFYEITSATATPTNTPTVTNTPTITPTVTPTPPVQLVDVIMPAGDVVIPR